MNHLDQDLEEIMKQVDDLKSRLRFLSPGSKKKGFDDHHRGTITQPKRPIPFSVANLGKVTKKGPQFINPTEGCCPETGHPKAPEAIHLQRGKSKKTLRVVGSSTDLN